MPDNEDQLSDQTELDRVAAVIAAGPYTNTWESLPAYEAPRWFCGAKFGVFIPQFTAATTTRRAGVMVCAQVAPQQPAVRQTGFHL